MSKLRINSFKSDPTGWIGSGVMLTFAAIAAWRWSHSGLIFFALTGLRDLLAAWLLMIRRLNQSIGHALIPISLAYISSALPLMYIANRTSTLSLETLATLFAIFGFTLSTFALVELGDSFGVSPANRGRVTTGIYRYINHPMYLGYLIAEIGFVLLNPLNLLIFMISSALYLTRTKLETNIVTSA